jgi:pimeloyl-ACP methyl ester carboxylesterase
MADVARESVALDSPTAPRTAFGGYPHEGIYHTLKGTRPEVAFIICHHVANFADHYLGPLLAARGFGVLGWSTRYKTEPAYFRLEHALIDVGVGVQWLRETAGVKTVVMIGNSGGGSLMAAYQAQATDPDTVKVSDEFNTVTGQGISSAGGQLSSSSGGTVSVEDAVRRLPPADLYISLNAHQGRPDVLTTWMDPSVIDENDLLATDPELDMFNPQNGPPYSPEFLARYRQAQRDRNNRISAWARSELAELAAHGINDRMFTLNRVWADPRFLDLSIDPSKRDVGCYAGDPRTANYSAYSLVPYVTLRGWLSMWSLSDAQCRGMENFSKIKVPSLVLQSTGDKGVFLSDAQAVYDNLGASDRTLKFIPGGHFFEGKGDSPEEAASIIAEWASECAGT